ncbi:MAG: FAD-binding oxidoreductase [Alphaproteobacteria bacterium]|nr:FAD-binding oxidoreductase [Alphaproteobacteria bacterium]
MDELRAALGPKGWSEDAERLAPLLTDARGRYRGRALGLVQPATTEETAEAVRICARHRLAIVPQGGNTGLVGGATPEGPDAAILLQMGRMHRIRELDLANDTLTVEAGAILADVQAAAREAGRLFPLSLASEGSAQIGGVLSTNAGGNAVLRYGNARELVLGLEVVLGDGRVWNGLRGLRKDNTGYDLKQLFIGAEGTLGIVTAAVLKLFPAPSATATALVAVPDPKAAVALLGLARQAAGEALTSFELMPRIGLDFVLAHIDGTRDPLAARHDWYVLLELAASGANARLQALLVALLENAMAEGLVADAALAETLDQRNAFWRLRDSLPEAQKHAGGSIKHDVAVPVSKIPDFLSQASALVRERLPGVRVCAFGHLGDGNLHFNLSQPEDADTEAFLARWDEVNGWVHDLVVGQGGSFAAEHGIGQMKRDALTRYKSAVEIELMRRLKTALDPEGILNPGKLLS